MPGNDEEFVCPPQFMFNSGGTLRIIFLLFDSNVYMCAKFWESMLTGFWIYGLHVKLTLPGQKYAQVTLTLTLIRNMAKKLYARLSLFSILEVL